MSEINEKRPKGYLTVVVAIKLICVFDNVFYPSETPSYIVHTYDKGLTFSIADASVGTRFQR